MVTEREWLEIRSAARCRDWDDVARRAKELEWPIVARHAMRARFEADSVRVLVFALLLDRPDEAESAPERRHA